MDFVIPARHRLKIKVVDTKKNTWTLPEKLKKVVEVEVDRDTNRRWSIWYSPKENRQVTKWTRYQKKNLDHLDHSTA